MNKRCASIGICVLLLSGCIKVGSGKSGALAPCSALDSAFSRLPFDQWKDEYHKTVSEIIDAHMESVLTLQKTPMACTSPSYMQLQRPNEKLRELAVTLPPWQTEVGAGDLSETDLGPALLEYLRIYECAMLNRRNALREGLPKEYTGSEPLQRGNLENEASRQASIINDELLLARPALERTLAIVGGIDRLRPLSMDIECLKRSSLDLRNVLGLAAQAASCLPRARDVRGSLRDYPQE